MPFACTRWASQLAVRSALRGAPISRYAGPERPTSASPVNDQAVRGELDELGLFESDDDGVEVLVEE